MCFPYFLSLLVVLISWPALAIQKEFTIDDSDSSVRYDPPDAWNSNGNCPNGKCYAQPDPSQISMQTWHESTFRVGIGTNAYPNTPLSVTVKFQGDSVQVYAVIPQSLGSINLAPTAAVAFSVDGQQAINFSRPSATGYTYNVLVYDSNMIPLGPHELKITNGIVNGMDSLFILDRIVYSVNEPPDPPVTTTFTSNEFLPVKTTSPTPTTSIAGHTATEHPPEPSSTHSLNNTTPSNPGQITPSNTTPPNSSTYSLAPTTPLNLPPSPNTPNSIIIEPKHRPPIGIIVGAALGSLAGVLAIVLIMIYCRRRRHHRPKAPNKLDITPTPFESAEPGKDDIPSPVSLGWRIASDTKRDIMAVPPPAYCS
ncbi:hypothetical protein BDZ94DRAFT_589787 [Collybia nuda]|uniref:Uncharacterized protein n=1 Tax=Collybia nuda TaxID=64659 RepID=A0A9P6CF77_9AGAR|nr:hypothetical protein BDZ94DRAFT_589787 [Collybia nuda]